MEVDYGEFMAEHQNRSKQYAALSERAGKRRIRAGGRRRARTVGVGKFHQRHDTHVGAPGYVAVAPNLYHRDGPDCKDDNPTRKSRLRDTTIIKDIEGAIGFLKSHSRVDGGKLGIVGFCMGGRLVYLMSAASRDIKAGVMFYGSGTMVPFGEGPTPFERTSEINCPIQGHFGAEDKNPSPEDMRKLDAELTKFGKAHEFHTYAGAAHAFVNTGSSNYRPRAAALSWPKAMEFFSRHLVSQ